LREVPRAGAARFEGRVAARRLFFIFCFPSRKVKAKPGASMQQLRNGEELT